MPDDATIEKALAHFKDGSSSVSFTVTTYTRDEIVTHIRSRLEQDRWTPRVFEWLNPTRATSFERGWRQGGSGLMPVDAEGNPLPPVEFHEWRGEWENRRGDVITYQLSAIDGSIRAHAAYVPRRLIREVRRRMEQEPG